MRSDDEKSGSSSTFSSEDEMEVLESKDEVVDIDQMSWAEMQGGVDKEAE